MRLSVGPVLAVVLLSTAACSQAPSVTSGAASADMAPSKSLTVAVDKNGGVIRVDQCPSVADVAQVSGLDVTVSSQVQFVCMYRFKQADLAASGADGVDLRAAPVTISAYAVGTTCSGDEKHPEWGQGACLLDGRAWMPTAQGGGTLTVSVSTTLSGNGNGDHAAALALANWVSTTVQYD